MTAILFSLGCFVTTMFGGWLSIRIQDKKHLLLGTAAGLMLGVVLFDLLPEALDQNAFKLSGVPLVLILVTVGFLILNSAEHWSGSHESSHGAEHEHSGMGIATTAPLILHSVLDGVGIGLAFQVGGKVGLIVALAILAHDVADGFNTYTLYGLYSKDKRMALRLLLSDAIAPVVGATSTLFFRASPSILGALLGLFTGFLLYLATAEILPEAHADHSTRRTLLCTLAGTIFIFGVVGIANS